jgi:hypothetical protein
MKPARRGWRGFHRSTSRPPARAPTPQTPQEDAAEGERGGIDGEPPAGVQDRDDHAGERGTDERADAVGQLEDRVGLLLVGDAHRLRDQSSRRRPEEGRRRAIDRLQHDQQHERDRLRGEYQPEVSGRVRQIENRERQRHRHQQVADGGDGPAREQDPERCL